MLWLHNNHNVHKLATTNGLVSSYQTAGRWFILCAL